MRSISARKSSGIWSGKPIPGIAVICLAVLLLNLASVQVLTITRAAAGDLDTTFGNGGKVMADLFGQNEVATAVALQSDNKIVVAGYSAPTGAPAPRSDFALSRFNPDGTLDLSFGNGGKVLTDFDATHQDQAKAVAIQSDGKIVAAGFTSFSGSDDNTDYAFALARYNADGTLDQTFGNQGKVITNHANPAGFNIYYRESINALAIQNDGRIVATGTAFLNPAQSMDFTTVRYNQDGSLDQSFGMGGKVFTNFPNTNPGEPNDSAGEIFIQSNGKIIIAGRVHHLSFEYGIARLNSDGSLDQSFGQGGLLTTSYPRQSSGNSSKETAMAVQSDGKIIIGGLTQSAAGTHCALLRLDASGNLDSTFGTSGQVTARLSGAIHSVKIQPNGKIIAAGDSPDTSGDFAVMRYTANGSLDESFGNGGIITTDFSGNQDLLYATAIQSDGKIVAVGASASQAGNFDFALARYLSGEGQSGIHYDLCVQDEESKNYVEINSLTGEYLLTRCDLNWLAGTGVIAKEGATFSLKDESSDRVVSISLNLVKRKGQVTIHTLSPKLKTRFKDSNIDNNSCACR